MEHEYAVLGGFNRANVGKWVMGASVGLAAAVSALAGLVVALVVDFGVEMPRLVLWPITAGSIYLLLYALFDRWMWRIPRLSRWLRVPNLSGTWVCHGQSLHASDDRPSWHGKARSKLHRAGTRSRFASERASPSPKACRQR